MVSVIRFCYGRILLWQVLSGSGMKEFCDGKCYQVLIWKNFVTVSDIMFWYERILL